MTNPIKNRLFEQYQIPTEGNDLLHAKLMLPKRSVEPRRVVFIAPLVGASAATALLVFRDLTRRGSILVSFEYRGHPRSTGTFTLDGTVPDTRHALVWAWNYANDRGLPLHGFSAWSGMGPMLAQFAGCGCGVVLKSLCGVSALLRLDHILRFEDFAPVLSRHLGREFDGSEVLAGIRNGSLDPRENRVRRALLEFLGRMISELNVGLDYFEELRYDRSDMVSTLLQFSQSRYLDGVAVPSWLPCYFFYGRNDELMSLHLPEGREAYREQVLSLMPHAELCEAELDHFGRGTDHDRIMERLGDIFQQHDNAPIPVPHFRQTAQDRTIPV